MPRTEPTRLPELMSHDRDELDALLASTVLAHVGLVVDGHPVVIPTAAAAWGDRLLIHGSTGSTWMRRIADGAPVCVSIAAIDGVVVARSAFESAVMYRSAVLFGAFTELEGPEKEKALDALDGTSRTEVGQVLNVTNTAEPENTCSESRRRPSLRQPGTSVQLRRAQRCRDPRASR